MSIDPFREVRDAVRPFAAAGQLTDMRATQIAMRHRVDEADVRRIYSEEHARLRPQTPPAVSEDEPAPPPAAQGPSLDQPDAADEDGQVVPACEPSDARAAVITNLPHEFRGFVRCLTSPWNGTGHGCGLRYGHDGDHVCGGPNSPHHSCDYRWPQAPPDTVTVEPLTGAEQAKASDMALVSDAVLALSMLGDHPMPDKVRHLLDAAMDDVQALHNALRDHHRNADLIAERAVLAARLAEIDAALGYDDQANDDQPPPQPEVGGGRVNCPKCGKEFYRNGLPRHMATHKKQRGAA